MAISPETTAVSSETTAIVSPLGTRIAPPTCFLAHAAPWIAPIVAFGDPRNGVRAWEERLREPPTGLVSGLMGFVSGLMAVVSEQMGLVSELMASVSGMTAFGNGPMGFIGAPVAFIDELTARSRGHRLVMGQLEFGQRAESTVLPASSRCTAVQDGPAIEGEVHRPTHEARLNAFVGALAKLQCVRRARRRLAVR
jgi:hypothetical protein